MNEQPDDWYKQRESKPDFDGSKSGGIANKAAGAAGSKAKDGVQKLEEKALKEGLKAGISAVSGGAGAAAAPVIDKLDKIPVVKDAFKLLAKIFLPVLIIGGLAVAAMGILTVLMPIIIMTAIVDEAADEIADSALVRGGAMVVDGVSTAAGAVGDTADAIIPGDGIPCIGIVGCGYDGSTADVAQTDSTTATLASANTATSDQTPKVLAATASDPNSRLRKLYGEMRNQGFFKLLYTKYGLRVKSPDHGRTYKIFLNDQLLKTVNSKAALDREFKTNRKLRIILTKALKEDLHILDYTQRVTMAEKGLENYSSSQLFIPGADEAATPEELTTVRQKSLETQNNPFLGAMTNELNCTNPEGCGTWVPETVQEDSVNLSGSISEETGYKTEGTLYSRMKARLKEARDDANFLDWYRYVREIDEASKLTTKEQIDANTFIQGTLKTRKDQAARQFMHWRTAVDQYKSTKMTSASATALFRNFEGGASSKAYRHLSGQPGGKSFKEYQKINDTSDNIVKTIYEKWLEDNPQQAPIVKEAIENNLLEKAANGGWLSGILANIFTSDVTKETVIDSGFELGQQIMLPVCDGSKSGANFTNCLYAGAETTARDIGISDYGHKGNISKEELQQVANYVGEVEAQIAAERPFIERLTSIEGPSSFARTFLMNAAIPLNTDSAMSSLLTYFLELPAKVTQLAVISANPSAMAAEDDEKINNIKPAGNTLGALTNTPISATLDDPAGSLASCPVTTEDQENLCRTDETTYLALAAKFSVLDDDGDITFNVGSYNILHADHHTPESISIGGCTGALLASDPKCSKTRSERQAQIIKGQAGAPVLDIVGMQEVSPGQYNQLKVLLPEYDAFPTDTRRMSNNKDGAVAIFWNKAKFTRFAKGKAAGVSNTGFNITYPWVGLQASGGQKVYVMSIHYPNDTFGGTDQVIKRASRLTMDWVKSKVSDDALVIVMGDFNDPLTQRTHYCVYTERGLMQHAHDLQQGDNLSQGCDQPDTEGIDHIYTTPTLDVKASGWTHMANTGVVAQSSDHRPVYTTLTLPSSGPGRLKIATFNILHVGDSQFEQQWRTRMPTSINVLKQNGIGVAGLQEVRPEQHRLLTTEAYAKDTYDIFPKTAEQPGFSPNPIIWNKSLYSLVEGSAKTLEIEYDSGNKIDHAVLVKLKDGSGNEFYVLNTHDPANARPGSDQQNALSRLNNAKFYERYLSELAREEKPIFLTGDFNSSYTMNGNQKPYNDLAQNLTYCVISSGGVMKNVWDTAQDKRFECPRDSVPDNAPIDHIYTANITDVNRVWTAASRSNGSDHPTVMADIKMPWTGKDGGASVSYKNPVYNDHAADPSVIRGSDKTYFAYVTGLTRLSSKDLVHWKKESGGWNVRGMPRHACHWAPDVAKVGTKYVLTYSAGSGGCLPANSPDIHYAVGDSAGGPFTYKGKLGLNANGNFAIDSNLFVDDDGKAWLFYGGGVLRLVRVELSGDTLRKVGSVQNNLFDRVNPGDSTVEGWWVTKKNGWYYLYYSYGAWESKSGAHEYSTRIARSRSVNGPYEPRNQYKELLTGENPIRGPGHNSVATDNAGNEWIVYHGYFRNGGKRVLMIDPITYRDGWPVIGNGHPSSTLQSTGPVTGRAGGL